MEYTAPLSIRLLSRQINADRDGMKVPFGRFRVRYFRRPRALVLRMMLTVMRAYDFVFEALSEIASEGMKAVNKLR